jgi:DNA-binding NarL/FixJ family response regulator
MNPRPNQSASTSAAITCVVADHHAALRQALARSLTQEGIEVVRQASDGAEALAAVEELRPTVAILDLVMPHLGGVDVVRRAAVVAPETAVILYAGFAEHELIVEALDAGARGFVLKQAPLEELLGAVTTVARGEVYVDPALGATLVGARGAGKLPTLSAREREILRLLADGKTNKEIAEGLFISPDTVRTYIRRAMEKLEANTRTQAVAIAIRQSLI